ncbi:hypothetical protein [Olleya sp. YS]|uniref:hypothetical protein n=1 Tax=Olleya sp. YS TaxID=3028318 RepID=UPI00243447BB|nr:hypothetical protein [Olleya sp. YS]WGD34943.1 hypothetical protein Ollyesu_00675 [Olleya sp. YS]
MKEIRKEISYYLILSLLVIITTLISSCKENNTSETLKNHFTEDQIQDFNKINNFFISQALNNNKSNYKKELQLLIDELINNDIIALIKKIDFKKQKELYTLISKSSFNELWVFCKSFRKKRIESESFISICPNHELNNFKNYLKELSKTNSFAEVCLKSMEDSGDYHIARFSNYLFQNINSIDLNNFDNQFIIAVYFLSLNDNEQRNEKWSEKNKNE